MLVILPSPFAAFRHEIARNPVLRRALNHYLYGFMAQVTQTTGCNRFHKIPERLARWLLMTHDRVSSNEFLLTQDFLAHMLGVRRSSVTLAAGVLQKKNLIRYSRGKITVVNRKGLERASCECYRAVNDIRARLRLAPHARDEQATPFLWRAVSNGGHQAVKTDGLTRRPRPTGARRGAPNGHTKDGWPGLSGDAGIARPECGKFREPSTSA